MDFITILNGMNSNQGYKQPSRKKNKSVQPSDKAKSCIDEGLTISNLLKQELTTIQESFTLAQDKINVLEIANERLNDVSASLEAARSNLLENIRELKNDEIPTFLKERLATIGKLEHVEERIATIFAQDAENNADMSRELETISFVRNNVSQIKGLQDSLDSNIPLEGLLEEISTNINSVTSTRTTLDQVRTQLVANVRILSVTLENMLSVQNKIRTVDVASKTVALAKHQILKQAQASVSTQLMYADADSKRLFN